MRLHSATVRSYRRHRELTISFDPHLTLIVGDNESGKSTLVEAIHRALFLKSTVTGAVLNEMRSLLHAGYPEVELRFDVGGESYQLRKRFAGPHGTTALSRSGGQTWRGEEAEVRLAGLLGVEPAEGGKGIEKRLLSQWAHLWVWQGKGGEDPAADAATQQQQLLEQLQRIGGAVAMQSALDGRIAEHFAKLHDDLFKRDGKAKAGSALAAAEAEWQSAQERFRNAEARVARLKQAMSDFENAEASIRRAKASLEDAQRQLQAVDEKLEKLGKLREQAQARSRELEEIQHRLVALEEAERKIRALQERARKIEEALAPLQNELALSDQRLAELQARTEHVRHAHGQAEAQALDARRMRDLAVACERLLEAVQRQEILERQLADIESREQQIRERRARLARLPAIERTDLDRLESLERERSRAKASLAAAAPEVELLAAALPVQLGDRALSPGERVPVTEPADLRAGDLRLRIHPGGGESLASLRERVTKLDGEIRDALRVWGVASIDEATAAVVERQVISQEIEHLRAALEALNPASIRAQCHEAQLHRDAMQAELDRLQQVPGRARVLPETLEAAREQLRHAQQEVDHAESEERQAASQLEALDEQRKKLEEERKNKEQALQALQREHNECRITLRVLVEQAGDETHRREALHKAKVSAQAVANSLEETHTAIAELQPGLLEADKARLERVIHTVQETLRNAEQQRAAAHALLQSDGVVDPLAELAQADAERAAAEQRRQSEQRHARAIALVHELFDAQQRELAEHFSRPLAEKITFYLQPVLGPRAQAVARFAGNEFTGVELVRPDMPEALSFDVLSGGTREQVAAAVRLAIAELLATDHDGTLPIVFDDAFVNSDPSRTALLQRTLDLGARRGLQIIVLTCHSAYYTALGARQVFLEPIRATVDSSPASISHPQE
jgi:chromosome segregation ATPase